LYPSQGFEEVRTEDLQRLSPAQIDQLERGFQFGLSQDDQIFALVRRNPDPVFQLARRG
jgi:hypothetical protein